MPPFEIKFESKDHELKFTRNFLQNLLGAIRDPVMVLRPDYVILDVNQPLLDSVGKSREEVVGKKCHEVSHQSPEPCVSPKHECPLREAMLKRTSAYSLHEHYSGETGTRYFDVMAYPVLDQDGNIQAVLEVWRDISATLEREVEKKAMKIKEDLARMVHEDKMIALGKLVASAVHEINNPIAAIFTFSKVMLRMVKAAAEDGLDKDEMQEMERFLELVGNESKRCGDIVSNLLSFSRNRPMHRRQVDVNEVVGKIMLLLRHKMELQNIQLSVDLAPEMPSIHGDLSQIQQCIMNLVFNAVEAMPNGGQMTLRTRLEPEKGMVVIEVQDTGCGISEEDRSRIFEPFFSTKTAGKGIGLGLAVVYGIIKEHGGMIDFESEPGVGTTFRILLETSSSNNS
jgi:signal transduction histidine kinase